MRLGLAISTFFRILFSRELADQIRQMRSADQLAAIPAPTAKTEVAKPQPAVKKGPSRNDAITLLATLQREARFVDLVQESLDQYSDAQVGAAARDVLRDCGATLTRLFSLKPVLEDAEGESVTTPTEVDPHRFRVTGNAAGSPPFTGKLTHHGWEAAHVELPQWSGTDTAVRIVAPAEIEVS